MQHISDECQISLAISQPKRPAIFSTPKMATENDLAKSAAQSISAVNHLPQDLSFYTASYPSAGQRVRQMIASVLRTTNRLIRFVDGDRTAPPFEDAEDLIDRFDSTVVDALDGLLERVDHSLVAASSGGNATAPDQITPHALPPGSNPPLNPVVRFSASSSLQSTADRPAKDNNRLVIRHANIAKPQLKFVDKIDNNAETPFVIRLPIKYHSKEQQQLLQQQFQSSDDAAVNNGNPLSPSIQSHLQSLGHGNSSAAATRQPAYPHPYEHEIKTIEYPLHQLRSRPEQLFASLEETPFRWIDTEEDFEELVALLETQQEIAIDLEVLITTILFNFLNYATGQ
jgi:exosome complex exonuclease RRP6